MRKTKYLSVYITANDLKEARKIAYHLVEHKLAACVNVIPEMTGIYHWEGKVREGKEVVMVIKTRRKLFAKLEKAVKKLHSHEVPCIVGFPIEKGHAPFLNWIKDGTK